MSALGLHFGAVDLVNAQTSNGDRRPRVLEVNTAVGMEGTTASEYARTLLEEFSDEVVSPVSEPSEERDHRDEEDDPQSSPPPPITIGSSHRRHMNTANRSLSLGRSTCSFCDLPLTA